MKKVITGILLLAVGLALISPATAADPPPPPAFALPQDPTSFYTFKANDPDAQMAMDNALLQSRNYSQAQSLQIKTLYTAITSDGNGGYTAVVTIRTYPPFDPKNLPPLPPLPAK